MTERRHFGYLPDLPSDKDWDHLSLLAAQEHVTAPMRSENLDMLRLLPGILDQGPLGSCVANAGLGAVRLRNAVAGVESPELGSRLLAYYLIRGYIGTEGVDSGAYIRDLFRALNQYGFCREREYPYLVERFAQVPPAELFRDSFDQRDPARYWRIYSTGEQRVVELKTAIDAGHPVVAGAQVGNDFLGWGGTIRDEVPLNTGGIAGGHAFYGAGYNAAGLVCVNSWSSAWGDVGRFTISWDSVVRGNVDDLQDVWVVEAAPYFSEAA